MKNVMIQEYLEAVQANNTENLDSFRNPLSGFCFVLCVYQKYNNLFKNNGNLLLSPARLKQILEYQPKAKIMKTLDGFNFFFFNFA